MPKICCSAMSCCHNTDGCCCLSSVDINGKSAKQSVETCCTSFCENNGIQNSINAATVCSCSDIDCNAKKCVHNACGCCDATEINVGGAGACNCNQTECDSFCKR